MKYFQHITSLADLKKQYRLLAITHHPDRGGSTEVMQDVNAEFESLFNIWKDRTEVDYNGYENDYTEAKTSRQYAEYVWQEYRWRGSRAGTVSYHDLADEFRKFVKQAYPNCKFSITKEHCGYTASYYIQLEQADFEAFTPEYKASKEFKGYEEVYGLKWDRADNRLTDRCQEVMKNVIDFCESFNYDNSDSMTDYFDVGFYSHYYVGSRKHFFKYQPPALKGGKPEYQRQPTKHERLIQKAIGAGNIISDGMERNEQTGEYEPNGTKWLMKNADSDRAHGWAITYSQPSLLQKRVQAMNEVGILTEIVGGGCYEGNYKTANGHYQPSGTLNRQRTKHESLSGTLNDQAEAVRKGKMFEHNDIKFSEYLPELYRVLKKGTHCYLMINSRNLTELQTEAEKAGFVFQNLLVWNKSNSGGTPNKYYMQKCEFILMLSKRPARNINDMGTPNLLSVPNIIGKGEEYHPTQKPIELLKVMIRNSTNVGDIVLDPFAGSGSTLVAAQQLERHYIGYEIDEKYYQMALRNLRNTPKQTTLFD